jgi:hypothetical protein
VAGGRASGAAAVGHTIVLNKQERIMKIQVIQKGNSAVPTMHVCPWVLEVPPEPPRN